MLLAVAVVLLIAGLIGRWLVSPKWDEDIVSYAEFVEDARGLEFDRPVDIEWVPVEERLNADFGDHHAPTAFDPTLEGYVLLGLVDSPGDDKSHQEVVDDTAAALAAGYYNPQDQTIYIDEDYPEELLALLVVHELVHALQDQHDMLGYYVETQDAAATRTALIEGDAERIADSYFDQLSEAEKDVYRDAWDGQEWQDRPNTFVESSFAAAYSIGTPMVYTLVETDGVAELDRLLQSSSIGSSERLVDPLSPQVTPQVNGFVRFRDHAQDLARADGDIGALHWFRALAPLIGTADALTAIQGYDDDAFGVYDDGESTCATFIIWFDTVDDAVEFIELVGPTALTVSATTEDTAVRAETCEAIGDPAMQRFATMLPIVVGTSLTAAHIADGYSHEIARCAATAQAAEINVAIPATDSPQWDELAAMAQTFLAECARVEGADG